MTLKYYVDHRSGSCRRVSAVIAHLGIEVEEINIDLLAGEAQSEAYRELNPFGMVPLLIDERKGGEPIIISEAAAIMFYLCEEFDDNNLLPNSIERTYVTQWMFWAAEHFRQPAPIYFVENIIAPLQARTANSYRLDYANEIIDRHAAVLDAHLEGRNFVVGNSITLADFDLAAPLSHMARSRVPYDQFPNIRRWADHLNAVCPAWKKTGDRLVQEMDNTLNNQAA